MDLKGYCTPHKCHLCQDLYLDFSLKEPWEILRPLHMSIQTWSTERQDEVPNWIMPLSIRAKLANFESFTLLSKLKSLFRRPKRPASKNVLNDLYREALAQDDALRVEAANLLKVTRFYDITFRECADRARRGCNFFSKLVDGDTQRMPPRKIAFGEEDCILGIHVYFDGLSFGVPRFGPHFYQGMGIYPIQNFMMVADKENPAAEAIPNRPIELEPGSQISLLTLKHHFQECQSQHVDCQNRNPAFTPTRLLELYYENRKRMLRVMCTSLDFDDSNYVAVSYCWGKESHFTTTRANLHRRMNGFSCEDLPATLRDVVLIAERLEIRFLWIDSLCIIQDDMSSKNTEMQMMVDIYKNAIVTISASRAKDISQGILNRRIPLGTRFPDHVFEMRYNKNLTRPGSVVLSKDWSLLSVPEDDPLDYRAWALQERLVSRRIIDIGSQQTRWVCHSLLHWNIVDGGQMSGPQHSERSFQLYRELLHFRKGYSDEEPINIWHKIVLNYSHRQITELSDRLPAIAAIAQEFSELLGPTFLAGLWYSTLAFDLLWHLSATNLSHKPKVYLGPSWSWISTMEPITYEPRTIKTPDGWKTCLPPLDEKFVVVEHDIQLKCNEFKFGEVSSARLVVKGRHRKALWVPGSQDKRSGQLGTLFSEDAAWELPAHFAVDHLDDDNETDKNRISVPVELLLIAAEPDTETRRSRKVFLFYGDIPTRKETCRTEVNDAINSETSIKHNNVLRHLGPVTNPYFHLKGLVLRQLSSGDHERLGVFDFRQFHSSDFKIHKSNDGSKSWNDAYANYHSQTNWMMEGDIKTFTLV